jgi:hypothetical protein
LESHPQLQECVAYCIDCGIRFLTHPRNAGRRKLRCAFGCRRQHRRQSSNQRCAAYYHTPEGKRRKKRLNARRQCRETPPDLDRPASPANEPGAAELPVAFRLRLSAVVLDEPGLARSPMLPYVRMLVGLIEGIQLTPEEVLGLLRQGMRQRSIGVRKRIDYALDVLHQHPP